jgi:hypothetical protein
MYIFLGEKLVWRIFFFHFISHIFYPHSFAPIGLQKTNASSGWMVKTKYLSVNYCDFLTLTDTATDWPLRNITNPTGWDSFKKYLSRGKRLCSSRDGVHWGKVKDTCRQESTS